MAAPNTQFGFHVLVEAAVYPNRIFDASFGVTTDRTTAASAEAQWEDDHVMDLLIGGTPLGGNPAGADLTWFDWTL